MTMEHNPHPSSPPGAELPDGSLPRKRGRAREGVGLHGWLIIDKPAGMTSARIVAMVKRSSAAAKVGHAGTLDPLATGVLPLALGEATKTVRFATAGKKRYRFRIRWGLATDSDDRDGRLVGESAVRPTMAAIAAALPGFTGTLLQRPPAYSALKVAGARAYALARAGNPPELAPRRVEIARLDLTQVIDADHAEFEATVGEGTYIRSLARDLAAALGTLGHIVELRRLGVGRFTEGQAISLDLAVALGHNLAASEHLLPIETALDDIPALAVTAEEAARLRHGQAVTPRDTSLGALAEGTTVGVRCEELLIAVARIEAGAVKPARIINR